MKPEDRSPSFSSDDYELVERTVLYKGMFCLANYQVRHRLFKGGWSPLLNREILERKSAAAILPYDPVLDKVVLIEQFRPGALSGSTGPWLLETVAGILAPGEGPAELALREAKEEADCEVLALFPICDYFVSPGGSNEYLHLYCGQCDVSRIGGIHGLQDEHEDIRAFTLSSNQAFEMVKMGKIKTSPAIIALQWLQLNREWLRDLWQKK